jgi:hypothetical protein
MLFRQLLLWTLQYNTCTTNSSKIARDPRLVALTMNMDAVCHYGGDGLCNAVALKSGDRKLGRMVWDHDHEGSCRKLHFANQSELDENMQTVMPLLDDRQHDASTNL